VSEETTPYKTEEKKGGTVRFDVAFMCLETLLGLPEGATIRDIITPPIGDYCTLIVSGPAVPGPEKKLVQAHPVFETLPNGSYKLLSWGLP
jgi:hypothetical protein